MVLTRDAGKVYDSSGVPEWHPGGKLVILGDTGQVHQDTSTEFTSIHDGYAYQKLGDRFFPIRHACHWQPILIR